MLYGDCFILIGVGGFFLILGIAIVIWGRSEEKGYYDSLSSRTDVREYLERWPQRSEPGALKIGGWIAIAVGVVILATGGAFWLWG